MLNLAGNYFWKSKINQSILFNANLLAGWNMFINRCYCIKIWNISNGVCDASKFQEFGDYRNIIRLVKFHRLANFLENFFNIFGHYLLLWVFSFFFVISNVIIHSLWSEINFLFLCFVIFVKICQIFFAFELTLRQGD